ncbi:MAG: PAS domain S-box protein [SAR324 cluster bacterium]|nr:PAS domain S-box protein [SAR324 cluster bacterium]
MKTVASKYPQNLTRLTAIIALMVVALMVLSLWYLLQSVFKEREIILEQTHTVAISQAQIVGNSINTILLLSRFILLETGSRISPLLSDQQDIREDFQRIMQQHMIHVPQIAGSAVLDMKGNLLAEIWLYPGMKMNISPDLQMLLSRHQHDTQEIMIRPPHDSHPVTHLSVLLYNEEGTHPLGVLLLLLDLSAYFEQISRTSVLFTHAAGLMDPEGLLHALWIHDSYKSQEKFGNSISEVEAFSRLVLTEALVSSTGMLEATDWDYAIYQLKKFPFRTVLALNRLEFEQHWRSEHLIPTLIKGLVLWCALWIMISALWYQTRIRNREEQKLRKSREELSKAELRYRSLVNTLAEGVVLYGRNGQILEINPSAEQILGVSRNQVIGRSTSSPQWKVIHPDGREFTDEEYPVRMTLRTGVSQKRVITGVQHEQGSMIWLSVNSSPIFLESTQSPDGVVTSFTDITELKLAEDALAKSRDQFEQAVRGAQHGIWDWDLLTNEMYFSPQWKQILGYDDDALANVPETFINLLHLEDQPMMSEKIQNYLKNGVGRFDSEFRMRHKNGSYVWISGRGELFRDSDGKPVRVSGSHTDITERKILEEKLVQAQKRAEQASLAKSRFLANISHEIRTPLNAILGFASLLSNIKLEPEEQDYLKGIHIGGQNLLLLINDVLDLSKIEAGRLELRPEPVNLLTMAQEMRTMFLPRVQETGVQFEVNVSPTLPTGIMLDEVRIRQILINLLSNAFKFTSQGQVKFSIVETAHDHDPTRINLLLEVEDTGIGIAEDQQQLIFDVFTQIEGQSTRRYGGTGLGLSITRQLVSMMGGKIHLRSVPGQGSLFRINLYGLKLAELETPTETQPARDMDLPKATVLIVDDNKPNRMVIRGFLHKYPITCLEAVDGYEGVNQATAELPDLILMDVHMPGMDGIEATRLIRENPKTAHIPIVILTASALKEESEQLKQWCAGYLFKPISPKLLIKTIHTILTRTGNSADDANTLDLTGLPEVLQQELREEFQAVWPSLANHPQREDLESFVQILQIIADSHQSELLHKYAEQLSTASLTGNSGHINAHLQVFSAFMGG